jgi:hypothetical protein
MRANGFCARSPRAERCAAAKAMELFLQTLATKAVAVAQQRKAKTLTASHLCVSARAQPLRALALRSDARVALQQGVHCG